MIWKFTTAFVIAFWLVMNFLYLKWEIFPHSGRFDSMPPSVVLERFFDQADPANELTMYLRKQKIGAVTLAPRNLEGGVNRRGLKFIANLRFPVEGQIKEVLQSLSKIHSSELQMMRLVFDSNFIIEGDRMESADVKMRLPDANLEILLTQKEGEKMSYHLKLRGALIASSDMPQSSPDGSQEEGDSLVQGIPGPFLDTLLSGTNLRKEDLLLLNGRQAGEGGTSLNLSAETGIVEISGQRQEVFRLILEAFSGLKLNMEFSQAGEIMRVSGIPEVELRSPLWLMEEE